MRFGWLEIVLTVLVIIAVAIITRIIRSGRIAKGRSRQTDQKDKVINTGRTLNFFNLTGITLIIAGGIALIVTASFFHLILQSYLWAFLAITAGIILLRFSGKNKERNHD